MIGAMWNVRGLNKSGRSECIKNFIDTNKLDFVGLQETKKATFDVSFLTTLIVVSVGTTCQLMGLLVASWLALETLNLILSLGKLIAFLLAL